MIDSRTCLFDQDRLDAYKLGREFTRVMEALLRKLPRGHGVYFDQLRRATLSITLNTAEGAGELKPKEKARFYRIARRSCTECAAVMDSFVDRGILRENDIVGARTLLNRVTGALTRLIQSCDPANTRPKGESPALSPRP